MFWLFTGKKRIDEVKEETKKGFESVKKDILSISDWIKHLDSEKNLQKKDISELKQDLSNIKLEIFELKKILSEEKNSNFEPEFKQPFKTNRQLFNKQTAVYSVQTPVQTGVQTPNLQHFSITERAIIGILLNSDLKLSYEDIAAILGKDKSTIRGQINAIKSKSESLIQDFVEKNGKKRVFIPSEMKQKLLKKTKVRVKEIENSEKNEEKSELD